MDTLKLLWLCGTPLAAILSLLLLFIYGKQEIARLAGIYSILPGLNLILLLLISPLTDFKQTVTFSAVIDFVFIIPVVYLFRRLYRFGFVVPWLLLIFEIFRSAWLILYALSTRSRLSSLEAGLYYFYYFVPFAILLYCLFIGNKKQETEAVN